MSKNLSRPRTIIPLLLIIIIGSFFNIHIVKASLRTVHVDASNVQGPWDGGPEHPFQNITSGLAHASDSDTVLVHNGTYYEHLVIDKPISLIGENEFDTIIDGSELGTIIKVVASNVTITGFTIQNIGLWHYTLSGIYVVNANNNTLTHNTIQVGYRGIYLANSCTNTFTDNDISKTIEAISVIDSNNTILSRNKLSDNQFAMVLNNANNDTIFHNNFMNNANFVSSINSTNLWDNDVEGNYWSNYTGKDEDQDGIGDSPHVINAFNHDNYPLMGTLTDFAIAYENETQHITIISNSTVSAFDFNATFRILSFNATTNGGADGFCRITIPQVLCASPYIVLINDEQVNATLLPASNATQAFLYFTYNQTIQEVKVISEPSYELATKYNALLEKYNDMISKYDQLLAAYGPLNQTYWQILENYTSLNQTYGQLQANYVRLQNSYNSVETAYNNLLQQSNLLNSTYGKLESENAETRTILWIVSAATIAIAIITPWMTISYRRKFKDQRKLAEKYRAELERISLHDTARVLFEADVKRRKEKIEEFQDKYGIVVRPRESLGEAIKSLELRKKTEE